MSNTRSSDTTKSSTIIPVNSNNIQSSTILTSDDSQFTLNSQTQTLEISNESSSQILQHMISVETTEIQGEIVTNKSSKLFVAAANIITAIIIASFF